MKKVELDKVELDKVELDKVELDKVELDKVELGKVELDYQKNMNYQGPTEDQHRNLKKHVFVFYISSLQKRLNVK